MQTMSTLSSVQFSSVRFSSVQCITGLFTLSHLLSSCLTDFSFWLKASQSSESRLCTSREVDLCIRLNLRSETRRNFSETRLPSLCPTTCQTCRGADRIDQAMMPALNFIVCSNWLHKCASALVLGAKLCCESSFPRCNWWTAVKALSWLLVLGSWRLRQTVLCGRKGSAIGGPLNQKDRNSDHFVS